MPADLEALRLSTADRQTIVGDRLHGETPGYLFLHGLASVRAGEKSEHILAHARECGRAFVRFDFRGHGESSGALERITLSGLLEDARAALAAAGPSLLIGSSLGGLVASWLAAENHPDVLGLVLLAPAFGFLPRLDAMARDAGGRIAIHSSDTPTLLHESALDDARGYDECALPERITVPLLVVHGEHDEAVPLADAERFFASVPHERKRMWVVPGGDHRLNEPIADVLALVDEFFA